MSTFWELTKQIIRSARFFSTGRNVVFCARIWPPTADYDKIERKKKDKKDKKKQQKTDNNTDFDLLQLVPQEGRRYMVKDSSKD